MAAARVRLICWNAADAEVRAQALGQSGFEMEASPVNPSGVIGHIRAAAPAAVLIDLDRLPSHGREVAVALRQSKATRHIPIVFAGGAPDKVDRIRRELPDAFFTSWTAAARALRTALKNAPSDPIRPPAHMERYAATSLSKKLGIKPGTRTALVAAPDDFAECLGELPEGAELGNRITPRCQLALWFVRSRAELDRETEYLAAQLPEQCSLWIVHPKQTGRFRSDFNQNDVRAAALAVGLVDYKVCAVDGDWSGLKFSRKKAR